MIYKLFLLLLVLFAPLAHAVGEEQQIQAIKAMITPQQINQLIQKFQPSMKCFQLPDPNGDIPSL
jgi:hypothetical protein